MVLSGSLKLLGSIIRYSIILAILVSSIAYVKYVSYVFDYCKLAEYYEHKLIEDDFNKNMDVEASNKTMILASNTTHANKFTLDKKSCALPALFLQKFNGSNNSQFMHLSSLALDLFSSFDSFNKVLSSNINDSVKMNMLREISEKSNERITNPNMTIALLKASLTILFLSLFYCAFIILPKLFFILIVKLFEYLILIIFLLFLIEGFLFIFLDFNINSIGTAHYYIHKGPDLSNIFSFVLGLKDILIK